MRLKCTKTIKMDDGRTAFRAGKRYCWRYATEQEEFEFGLVHDLYAFKSEISREHFMPFALIRTHFEVPK